MQAATLTVSCRPVSLRSLLSLAEAGGGGIIVLDNVNHAVNSKGNVKLYGGQEGVLGVSCFENQSVPWRPCFEV